MGLSDAFLNCDIENQMTQFNARAGAIPDVPNDFQLAKTIATSPLTTSNTPTVNRPVLVIGCDIPVMGSEDERYQSRVCGE